MKQQYSNHRRLVPFFHGVTFPLILAILIGSLINLSKVEQEGLYSASLLVIIAFVLLFLFVFTRLFALKAQDRAIRAEENLRSYVLTGHLLDPRLSMAQIVALRFASDQEFGELALRAVAENLSPNDIKKAIRHWKADHYRV
ncbi:MAG TPA: hypothetical protein DCQ34_01610 [Chitinophagaceae bacterium]|nr:hypothetical protein [Chitinophagaceae bacterium]HCY90107.1 hypothetical protein [Chitinophagaceae bacterium]